MKVMMCWLVTGRRGQTVSFMVICTPRTSFCQLVNFLQISSSFKFAGKSAGLVIERLRVGIPAEAKGEISSPEVTLCADSYSVSVPPPCYRSST